MTGSIVPDTTPKPRRRPRNPRLSPRSHAMIDYIHWREREGRQFDGLHNADLRAVIIDRFEDRVIAGLDRDDPTALDGIDWRAGLVQGRWRRAWRAAMRELR
jgi:hypothetical protein